ncbi:MAG: ADP-ribosylglycohydrolase family protein [Acidimicrobiia bacterium]
MAEDRNRSSADGAGAMLGLAAGDQLAALQRPQGSAESLYGFRTQQAIVVAYHLMRWGEIRPEELSSELVALAHSKDGPNAYRGAPTWFRQFLSEREGGRTAAAPSGDGAASLSLPIGLWYRGNVDQLVSDAIAAALITHRDGPSLAAASTYGGAVAAASFGQSGRDFLNAVSELAARTVAVLEADGDLDVAGAVSFAEALRQADRWIDARAPDVISGCTEELGPVGVVVAAVVIGAVARELSEDALRATATSAAVAPLVGGIIGARRGLAHWPWEMPNELWFAEIGRRLAGQNRTFEDLPDPYAVEVSMVNPTWAPRRVF